MLYWYTVWPLRNSAWWYSAYLWVTSIRIRNGKGDTLAGLSPIFLVIFILIIITLLLHSHHRSPLQLPVCFWGVGGLGRSSGITALPPICRMVRTVTPVSFPFLSFTTLPLSWFYGAKENMPANWHIKKRLDWVGCGLLKPHYPGIFLGRQ